MSLTNPGSWQRQINLSARTTVARVIDVLDEYRKVINLRLPRIRKHVRILHSDFTCWMTRQCLTRVNHLLNNNNNVMNILHYHLLSQGFALFARVNWLAPAKPSIQSDISQVLACNRERSDERTTLSPPKVPCPQHTIFPHQFFPSNVIDTKLLYQFCNFLQHQSV